MDKAEKIVRYIFKDEDILFRLLNTSQDSRGKRANSDIQISAAASQKNTKISSNGEDGNGGGGYGSLSYAMFMWRITFKKIVIFLIFIWSLISFVSFFINEDEAYRFLTRKIDSYLVENLAIGLFNILMSLVFLK